MSQPPESQDNRSNDVEPRPGRPSPERRFVQRQIVQPLIQWMPLGGSGWMFVSFLLKQEWVQVALTFPAMIVTGVWANYSKNFVERLSEIYAERGKRDADALTKWLDSLNETLKWQFSGFEHNYLKCQADDCNLDKTDGYKRKWGSDAELTKMFVPLRIEAKYSRRPSDVEIAEIQNREQQDEVRREIWDFLSQVRQEPAYQRMAILAEGGSGKTTLLRHITLAYATGTAPRNAPKRIPVLLYLRDYREQFANPPFPTLAQLITEHHLPKLPKPCPLNPPPRWADDLLQRGKALIMLDGFDEVDEQRRPEVSEWIAVQMKQYRPALFLLTSRPTGYEKDYLAERPDTHVTVSPFNKEERDDFIRKWYRNQERQAAGKLTPRVEANAQQNAEALIKEIDERRELQQMSTNPLLLKMIATFHAYESSDLPRYPTELYDNICQLQLVDRPGARKIPIPLNGKQRQAVLQVLALEMVEREIKSIGREELLELIRPVMRQLNESADPEVFLKQVVRVSELLVDRLPEIYDFAHLQFRDYLAAVQIKQTQQEDRLLQHWADDHWRATILLYAGLPFDNQPRLNSVIESACNQGTVEARALAWACVKACPYTVDAKLKQKLNSTEYLEQFLQNQQWVEADKETYRLMAQALGRQYGNYLPPDELMNFPCEPLLAIDHLWVKYSNGHFGFSVQKRIYVECGGTVDGKYPGEEIWVKFADRVGWRVEGDWVYSYEQLAPSLSSPQGILPVGFCYAAWLRLLGLDGLVLFSRIETCEL